MLYLWHEQQGRYKMFSLDSDYDYAPTDFDDDPKYIRIDEHQEAVDTLQNIIYRVKEEMFALKEAIETGDLRKIDDAMEEIYGYLEG